MQIDIYQGYQVKPHRDYPASLIIVTDGKGGKIPDCLAGIFTSRGIAKLAIDKYLDTKDKKDTKNAEAIGQS